MSEYKLNTVFEENADINTPFAGYPRPSLVRDSFFSLNGKWEFTTAGDVTVPKAYGEEITVPFPPESKMSGLGRHVDPDERLYYRRTFTLPDNFNNFNKGRIILHFGAADCICEVMLNGFSVTRHEGGYLPFSVDVTDDIREGENEITVKVADTLSHDHPYGKQRHDRGGMWYTPISGIWQTVWLESVPDEYIESIKITPSSESVNIEINTSIQGGKLTLKESGEVFPFDGSSVTVAPREPKLWSPEEPHLYDFMLECGDDRVESYFALRTVSVEKDISGIPRICLNGKPYLAHGLLDQGYYPDGIFLPATAEGYEYDIRTAKALGFNMLRKHIKIEPEIFYSLCDRLGMLVFQDMVNNSDYSFIRDTALPTIGFKRLSDKKMHRDPERRKIFKKHMLDTAEHLYNFPSVVYYTIFNEGWGQFTADEMYELLKASDPTRIIDSTSGWFWQKKSDVVSHHVYFKKLKIAPDTEHPTVISEFGGYSHRVAEHVFGEDNYGYKCFEDREEFENNVIELYENEVIPLVKKGISALVYTQISDIEDETNGFLTYDRRVLKVDMQRFRELSDRITAQNRKGEECI